MVAGGLAIMKQLFRDQMSSEELVTRLLETADDTGVYADRAVYGRGKLDLAAATHPVGVLEVPVGASRVAGADRAGRRLRGTGLSLGAAFGGGLARAVTGREIMAVDGLGAPFWYRLEDFVAPARGPAVDARLRGLLASPSGESREPGARVRAISPADGGHLALAEGGTMATFTNRAGLSASVFGSRPGGDAAGGALGWRPGGSPVGLRLGWIGEDERILGGAGHGAFGSLAADTAFLRVAGEVGLGAWRLGAHAEWGRVRARARGGLIDDVSAISTSAFGVQARVPVTDGDVLRFSVSQPLRVEDGRASLTLPWREPGTAPSGTPPSRPTSRPRRGRSTSPPPGRGRWPQGGSAWASSGAGTPATAGPKPRPSPSLRARGRRSEGSTGGGHRRAVRVLLSSWPPPDHPHVVMAGLVPAISINQLRLCSSKHVDGRNLFRP